METTEDQGRSRPGGSGGGCALELLQQIDELVGGAAEPIEPPDDEVFAAAKVGEGSSQPRLVGTRAGGAVLEHAMPAHAMAAELRGRIALGIELLILGRDAGVPDQRAGVRHPVGQEAKRCAVSYRKPCADLELARRFLPHNSGAHIATIAVLFRWCRYRAEKPWLD